MEAHPRAYAFDDPTVPHPARRYNYWLGGRENYKVDRAAGDAVAAAMPSIRIGARENRAFLRRAVRFMVEDGIRQLIDIGPGIPAPDCSHEVAQALAPETRVLYVDNDPVVIAYSRALLRSAALAPTDAAEGELEIGAAFDPEPETASQDGKGLIGHVLADLCDPERILANAELRAVIDFDQPVGLLLVAVAHFCVEDDEVYAAVSRLIDMLPSGSLVAFSHAATDYLDPRTKVRVDDVNRDHKSPFVFRYSFEVARFATGLDILEPGVVPISLWRAEEEPQPRPTAADACLACWVGRKP